jgi:hypothetical protein
MTRERSIRGQPRFSLVALRHIAVHMWLKAEVLRQIQIEQQKALHKGAYVIAYFEEEQTYGASPNVHLTFQAQTNPDFYNAWKRA